nr:uncharacterized protein LOC117982541 [Maniola hyperantus]
MSLNKAHKCKSIWAFCPADVLLVVFKQLDIKSLLNCMNVNIYWRNIVVYYCEHANLWRVMVQNAIDDEGVTFTEKTNLGWREQFLTAQQWFYVSNNMNVNLRHCYKDSSSIKNIYVHKDNLIVVTNIAVTYFNIANFENIKVIDKSCIRYEETSSMIVELSMASEGKVPVLTLTNKLYTNYVDSEKVKKIILEDIDSFKVHLDSCYEYSNKVLWMHTAKEIGWETKAMAKYHGIHPFCSLHIFKKNVYILLKSGTVLILDTECKMLVNVFHFNIPKLYQKWKPCIFHPYSLLLADQSVSQF